MANVAVRAGRVALALVLRTILFVLQAPPRLLRLLGRSPTGRSLADPAPGPASRPPVLDNPALGSHEVSSRGLHYVVAGDVGGKPIVLLHGFPSFWYCWRHQIPALVSEGYRVYAPDMRGYNQSTKPGDVSDYDMALLVDDVAHFIRNDMGVESAVLAGHDWGGVIAWFVAFVHPQLISKLVILNAPHPRGFSDNWTWAQLKMSWYIAFFQLPILPELLLSANNCAFVAKSLKSRTMGLVHRDRITQDDLDAYTYAMSQPGTLSSAINYYRRLLVPKPAAIRTALRAPLPMPVCIIWGAQDGALGVDLLNGVTKYAPLARIHVIDDASHWVMEDTPDTVNAHMVDFLSSTD